jgi:hypothetical protein
MGRPRGGVRTDVSTTAPGGAATASGRHRPRHRSTIGPSRSRRIRIAPPPPVPTVATPAPARVRAVSRGSRPPSDTTASAGRTRSRSASEVPPGLPWWPSFTTSAPRASPSPDASRARRRASPSCSRSPVRRIRRPRQSKRSVTERSLSGRSPSSGVGWRQTSAPSWSCQRVSPRATTVTGTPGGTSDALPTPTRTRDTVPPARSAGRPPSWSSSGWVTRRSTWDTPRREQARATRPAWAGRPVSMRRSGPPGTRRRSASPAPTSRSTSSGTRTRSAQRTGAAAAARATSPRRQGLRTRIAATAPIERRRMARDTPTERSSAGPGSPARMPRSRRMRPGQAAAKAVAASGGTGTSRRPAKAGARTAATRSPPGTEYRIPPRGTRPNHAATAGSVATVAAREIPIQVERWRPTRPRVHPPKSRR